jgi:uncharacterized protein involved in exopolysaccharide biosynthesis
MLVYERLYVVILIVAASVASAWLISESMTPVYRAQARFFLPTVNESFSLTREQSNLPNNIKFPNNNPLVQDSMVGILKTSEIRARVSANVPERDSAYLEKNTDIDTDKFGFTVVTTWDQDPRLAELVANEYVVQLQRHFEQSSRASEAKMRAVLQRAVDTAKEEITQLTTERLGLMSANDSVDFGSEFSALSSQIQGLRNKIAELDVSLSTITDRRSTIVLLRDARPEFVESSHSEVANPRLSQLKGDIGTIESELKTLALRFKPSHPAILEKEALLAAKASQLSLEAERVEGSRNYTPDAMRLDFDKQLAGLDIQQAALGKEREVRIALLDEALAEWRTMPAFKARLDELAQKISKKMGYLANTRSREMEFELYETVNPNFVEVTESAVAGATPHLPNIPVNLAVAAFFGLVLGIGMAVLLTRMRNYWEEAPW